MILLQQDMFLSPECVIQPQLNLTWLLLYCWPMSLAQRLCNCVLGDTDFIYGRKGH